MVVPSPKPKTFGQFLLLQGGYVSLAATTVILVDGFVGLMAAIPFGWVGYGVWLASFPALYLAYSYMRYRKWPDTEIDTSKERFFTSLATHSIHVTPEKLVALGNGKVSWEISWTDIGRIHLWAGGRTSFPSIIVTLKGPGSVHPLLGYTTPFLETSAVALNDDPGYVTEVLKCYWTAHQTFRQQWSNSA